MFTLRQIKEFDTISILETKQLLDIFNHIDVQPEDVIFFLDKGVIKCKIPSANGLEGFVEYYYFERVKDNIWALDIYALHNYEYSNVCMVAIDFDMKQQYCPFTIMVKFRKEVSKEKQKGFEPIAYSYAMIFYGVFAHFTKSIMERNVTTRKIRLKKQLGSEKKKVEVGNRPAKRKIKLISLNNIEYEVETSDYIYNRLRNIKKQEYKRHIEAWTVRGHIRHYKSGKEVLIKPYQKGVGKISGKEYVLEE